MATKELILGKERMNNTFTFTTSIELDEIVLTGIINIDSSSGAILSIENGIITFNSNSMGTFNTMYNTTNPELQFNFNCIPLFKLELTAIALNQLVTDLTNKYKK